MGSEMCIRDSVKAVPLLGWLIRAAEGIEVYLWLDGIIEYETGYHIHEFLESYGGWHGDPSHLPDVSIPERLGRILARNLQLPQAVLGVIGNAYLLVQLAWRGYQVVDPEYTISEFIHDGFLFAGTSFIQSQHALGTGESIVTSPTGSTGHSIP